jgi:Uma2 family endonuclease
MDFDVDSLIDPSCGHATMPTRAMATTTRRATEDDLWNAPEDGRKYELVDGDLVMSPAGLRHGRICARLLRVLGNFVHDGGLGDVFDSSTGFRLPGGNVRIPDVSFVSAARRVDPVPHDFGDLPPDLAVEVLSPPDRPRFVLDKVGEYLQAGVPLVWVIDPEAGRAAVHRSLTDVSHMDVDGTLDGGDVLPGFSVSLRDLLA